jgi:hypothetical protein
MIRTTLTRTEYPLVGRLTESEYPKKIKISQKSIKVKINNNLPFRVKFFPGIQTGSSSTNPAPIGVAVIGVNNYIL